MGMVAERWIHTVGQGPCGWINFPSENNAFYLVAGLRLFFKGR